MADSVDPLYDDVFRREYPGLVRTAALIVGDVEQAREIAQDAMLSLLVGWAELSSIDRPGAWARRVCIRLAVKARNRRSRIDAATVLAQGGVVEGHAFMGPADHELWQAVLALPVNQRAAIVLRYLEDLPTEEIAEILGCDAATVRVHLHRGRKALGLTLKEEVGDVVG